MISTLKRLATAMAALAFAAHAAAADLTLDAYNPGTSAMIPVSSVLVSGEHDVILVNAQFGNAQAEQLVTKIRASGTRLTTIYVSDGDPDYYFGLDVLTQAFPAAKVVATQPVVDHIKATAEQKLAFWGPKLGADKPAKAIIPQVLQGHSLTLEGKTLEVVGLDGPQPDRTFVWIPSIKAVVRRCGLREHPRVDGRYANRSVPRRLAGNLATHRRLETAHRDSRSLPGYADCAVRSIHRGLYQSVR